MVKPWYKKWWGIIIILILSLFLVLLVALSFYFVNLVKQEKAKINASNVNLTGNTVEINTDNNYWLGSANPEITIIEFVDFACPYCKNSYSNIREISVKYKNKVKIIFKDYPLYDQSVNLAMAARCAGEQGLFWVMHDKLFQNQGITEIEDLIEMANQIGADIDKFSSCLSTKKHLIPIQKDFSEGQTLDLTGTPIWFINGYKVEGDIPHDIFIQIIEGLLK